MKKMLMAMVLVLAMAGIAQATYVVYSGEGDQTIAPTTAVVGAAITALTWTYTFKTHNATNGYVVKFAFPDAKFATGTPVLTGTNATKSNISAYWQESGVTYLKITGSAASINDTLILTIPLAKCPDLAGTRGFKIYSVTNSSAITNTAGTAANATITVSAVCDWVASAPTPVILNDYKKAYVFELNNNQALVNGFVKLSMPNDTWTSITTTADIPGSVSVTSATGIADPVVASDGLSMLIAIPTLAVNQKITITFPDMEGLTPEATPLKTTYGINQQFRVQAVAAMWTSTSLPTYTPQVTPTGTIAETATATPAATSTSTYSVQKWSTFACKTFEALTPIPTATGTTIVGKFAVWVPSATVVLSASYTSKGTNLTLTGGAVGMTKQIKSTNAMFNKYGSFMDTTMSTMFDADMYGAYTVTGYVGYWDLYNDGAWRTNTSNAIALYKVPVFDDVNTEISNGVLTVEKVENSFCDATTPLFVTIYADTRYVYDADIFGNSPAVFYARVVGDDAANNTLTSYVLTGSGLYSGKGFINPIFTAEDVINYDLITGSDNEWNLNLLTIPLPAR